MSQTELSILEERRGIEHDIKRREIIYDSINMTKKGQDLEMEYELWELGQVSLRFVLFTFLTSWVMIGVIHVSDYLKWGPDLGIKVDCNVTTENNNYFDNPFCLPDDVKKELAVTLFTSAAVGGVVGGIMTDLMGRLLVYRFVLPFHIVGEILIIFSSDKRNAIFCRMVVVATLFAMAVANFSLLIEYCARQTRSVFCMLFFMYISLGYAMLGWITWFTLKWKYREVIWLFIYAPILIAAAFLLPESARLFAAYDRKFMAWFIIRSINNFGYREDIDDDEDITLVENLLYNFRQMLESFTDARMIRCLLYLCFPFFIASNFANYQTFDLFLHNKIDIFLAYTILGMIEMFFVCISLPLYTLLGQKVAIELFLLLATALNFAVYCTMANIRVLSLVIMMGLAFIFQKIALYGVCLLTAEIFPTVCRGTALGMLLVANGIGAFAFQLTQRIQICENCLPLFASKFILIFFYNILSMLAVAMLPPTRLRYLPDTHFDVKVLKAKRNEVDDCANFSRCFHVPRRKRHR